MCLFFPVHVVLTDFGGCWGIMFRNAWDQFDSGILEHYMHIFYEELKQCWCLAFEVQTQSISMDSVAGKTIWILFELFVGHRWIWHLFILILSWFSFPRRECNLHWLKSLQYIEAKSWDGLCRLEPHCIFTLNETRLLPNFDRLLNPRQQIRVPAAERTNCTLQE